MTVRTPPIFLQAGAHTAEDTRMALRGFFGSANGTFAGGVGADDPAHGVVRIGSSQLQVSENGTPNMSVNVNTGSCWIRGTESASQGAYFFHSDAVVNLSISAADATNARRDLIVAQVRDSGYSGSDDDARLFVVAGTPSGSPADPVVPANCLVLARVAVAAGATSITTANITDLRVYTRPWNTAWGVVALATRTSDVTFSTTSFVDATGLSVTFSEVSGRRYKVSGHVSARGAVNVGFLAELALTTSGNTGLQQVAQDVRNTSDEWSMAPTYFFTSSASGSTTLKLRGRANISSCSWAIEASSSRPAYLVVEDVGPA